ncbi:S41 family peptidase [Hymenobacter sp.]|uniref:S41 family peptidase n=1 Tax=Hymenobacter sp. TaxID=1898978 RepID=UPI00286C4052|nr:S41 family peptidase [Hymenobacter sp.]
MKILVISWFVLLIPARSYGQQLPTLTKAQMRADFDTLAAALIRINPHDFVRRRVNRYSQTDSILALRPAIDTITSTPSFFWLVDKALTFCQDGHTSVVDKRFYPFLDSTDRARTNAAAPDTAIVQAYARLYAARLAAYKLKLPLKYIAGKYVVLKNFTYRGTTIPAKYVLTACDKTTIHAYVRRNIGNLKDLHWDFANQRFYTENFTQSLGRRPIDRLGLTFVGGGRSITRAFRLNEGVTLTAPLKYAQPRVPAVRYLARYEALYLRMPVMRDAAYYLPKIDSLTRGRPLKKVILDVRDNPGGSDPEWQAILRHLIDRPIVLRITSCANRQNPRPDRLGTPAAPAAYQNKFFDTAGAYQLVARAPDTLTVDAGSIHFKGPIHVLQNENCFSSAGSLISTCQFSDQLINVGNSTGWFAGFGSMPWVGLLPNSRILYWTEPYLDFTNARQPADLFHNDVKIPVPLSAEEYAAKYSYAGDWYSPEYLLKYDKVFRHVLGLK